MATAPTLAVDITAIDHVTAVINKINARMAAFSAPMEKLGKSVNKFGDVSGLTRMGRAFGNIATEAGNAFQSVGQIVAPLGIISGAASIAGIYRMVSAWSEWGTHLGNAATRIGISAQALSGFQGAARLAGVSSETMTAGLQTLGQTMYDAIGGRAPEAIVMFATLGIAFRDATGHARNVMDVLPQVADKIAGLTNASDQARIATALFGGAGEQMLPFLRRGAAGIREYTIMAQRYGVGNAAAVGAANQFREAQTRVALAVEGLSNSVAIQLAPVITPLLGQMAEWIAANRDWIATGIGQEVRKFATWVQGINWTDVASGIHSFADSAHHVVDMLGGWQPAIEKFIGFMAGAWALSVLAPFATLAASIVTVGGNLALLAGEGIATAITRFGLLRTAAVEAGAAAEAATGGSAAVAASVGGSSFMRVAGAGLGMASRALPWAGALYGLETYLPHALSYATGQGWDDENATFKGASPNQRGGGSNTRRDPSAPSGRNAGPAQAPGDMSLARGIRNNNPLNLSYVPGQQGVTGSDGRFGQYGAMADGIAAAERQLLRYQSQGTDTIAKMITRWAPANENETGSYIAQVSKWTGIDAGAKVDMRDPLTAQKIIAAMARRESGGVSANEVQMGVGLALGGVPPQAIAPFAVPRQMPVAVASAPPRQIASQPPPVSPADLRAAGVTTRVSVDINGRLPPGFTATAKGGDNVDLGGGLVQQSRLGTVAG